MANNAYKILGITERTNRETGENRKYLVVEEAIPRRLSLNLSNQSADFIQELTSFVGKGVLLDTRDGVTENGISFTAFQSDSLLPCDLDYVRRKAVQSSPIQTDQPAQNDDTAKKPLFGKAAS